MTIATTPEHLHANGIWKGIFPEFLDDFEIEALVQFATEPAAAMLMLLQWHAGLSVPDVTSIRLADIDFGSEIPMIAVRRTDPKKSRSVPIHLNLVEPLSSFIEEGKFRSKDLLIPVTRQKAWRWYRLTLDKCIAAGMIAKGTSVGTLTVRHSAARRWILSGIPINVVSTWLALDLKRSLQYTDRINEPHRFMNLIP